MESFNIKIMQMVMDKLNVHRGIQDVQLEVYNLE